MSREDVQDRQIATLRRELRDLKEEFDTFVRTPLWKRCVFWLKGYRWRRFGRWYGATWNDDAKQYEEVSTDA